MVGTDHKLARKLLTDGKLVAVPTETVYGLAANALNQRAVLNIFKAKNRPQFDPLIVHIGNLKQLNQFTTEVPKIALKLADALWPGPLTMLLPKSENIPDVVTSGLPLVGIRMPAHPLTRRVLKKLDFPIAAPSANPFGFVSPTTAQHVEDQLGENVDYILDGGPCEVGIESTIVGFEKGTIVIHRLGGITTEKLKIFGKVKLNLTAGSNPLSPGKLDQHYATRQPLVIAPKPLKHPQAQDPNVVLLFYKKPKEKVTQTHFILSVDDDDVQAAKNLFAYLREIDKLDPELIIAEPAPERGLGPAINDRLYRASTKKKG